MTHFKINHTPVQKNFGNLFEEFFNELPAFAGKEWNKENWGSVPVNIHETPDAYHIEVSAPGRNKEDFKINIENGLLTISYEKKEEAKKEDYKTVRREFTYKSFKRSFTLDDKVNADNIQAKYENGLLKLLVPKKEQVKENARQINVD
ncbi:MAG: Hsp20/alpha crystallin family protein [Bacteroidetes bacterium]|nr:Hsp20/alpha crystallin family protein [Bacteroidota bacterium]MBS1933767.1 Hsp20/alpha crystallin family protein [Bacteroidota bacterium]